MTKDRLSDQQIQHAIDNVLGSLANNLGAVIADIPRNAEPLTWTRTHPGYWSSGDYRITQHRGSFALVKDLHDNSWPGHIRIGDSYKTLKEAQAAAQADAVANQ